MIKLYENKPFKGYICLDYDAIMVSNLFDFDIELLKKQQQIYCIVPYDQIIKVTQILKDKNISYYIYENNIIADQYITLTDKYKTYLAKIQDSFKDHNTNLTELAKMILLNATITKINNSTIPQLLEGRKILDSFNKINAGQVKIMPPSFSQKNLPPVKGHIYTSNKSNKQNSKVKYSSTSKSNCTLTQHHSNDNKIKNLKKPTINSVVTYKQNEITMVQTILPVKIIEEPIWEYDRKKPRTLKSVQKTISDADGKTSIACTTPIAKALMNHTINETFKFKDNYGNISTITILSIN
jgi:hypothetical protein